MAQQVQLVFKSALKATQGAATMGRSMSTGALGTIDASTLSPKRTSQGLHVSVQRDYPAAAALPLPANIDPTETTRFSPQRARDINSSAMLTHPQSGNQYQIDVTVDSSSGSSLDPHVQSYDCRGAVSLNSAMQSNVPSPFGGMHKFTHLNMPGGGWAQEGKYLSHDLNSSHYMNLRKEVRSDWSSYEDPKPAE